MESCALMHGERHVATVHEDGSCTVYDPGYMPYNLQLEETDASGDPIVRKLNLDRFYYWCATRPLTLERASAGDFLRSQGLEGAATDRERAEIVLCCHGLNLTDAFWLRAPGETESFAQCNLFEHPRARECVDVVLRDRGMIAKNTGLILGSDPSGLFSRQSAAPNLWLFRDGGYELLKGSSPREAAAELLASRIARRFEVDQVLYEPMGYQGRHVTRSSLVTTKEKSIVSAGDMKFFLVRTGQSLWELIRSHDEYGYHMMNIIDYLVGNTDRHVRNWGFWVRNGDHTPGKLFPLMDFNRSFLSYDTLEGGKCFPNGGKMSQKDAAVRGVQTIGLKQIGRLPDNLPALFSELNSLDGSRLDLMFRARLDVLRQAAREKLGAACEKEAMSDLERKGSER